MSELTTDECVLNISFSVSASDGRNITFGGPVSSIAIHDWFDKAGLAVESIFSPGKNINLKCVECGPLKIMAIKAVRTLTGIGLHEAKDFVEGSKSLLINRSIAPKLIEQLFSIGCRVVPLLSTEK